MENHKIVIPHEFRISIFLDTNILVYLVDNTFQNLTNAVNFLKECPFVDLYTSEYALLEFINKRKQEYYLKKLVYEFNINLVTAFNYHKEFNANEVSFESIKNEIKTKVENDIITLANNGVELEQHKLNQGIFDISKEICLNSKLTIYDSLVIASSLQPYCEIIFTNDSNFEKFYTENTDLDTIFTKFGKLKPQILSSKKAEGINFVDNNKLETFDKIKQVWVKIILNKVKEKELYLGEIFTQNCGRDSIICFTLATNCILEKEMFFTIVDRELSNIYESKKISEFHFMDTDQTVKKIEHFPFSQPDPTKISFRWEGAGDISAIKKAHNLVFLNPMQ